MMLEKFQEEWLFNSQSLTLRMQKWCGEAIRVSRLKQGFGPVFRQERAFLALKERRWAWVRQVELSAKGKPLVLARTVAPYHTLQGRAKRLTLLNQRPLGHILFNHLGAVRQLIEIEKVTHAEWLGELSQPMWQRRSIFAIDNAPLLVTELFLPDNPIYGKDS